MYAIIGTGGKQYRVCEGETVRVEKLPGSPGEKVTLEEVLLFSDGQSVRVGRPSVEGVSVHGHIVEQDKAKKVIVFKYKRRKRFRRKNGHRQPFTALMIDRIEAGQMSEI